MPTTADEEFPSPAQRKKFYELLGAILAFGTLLVTYWWFYD